MNGHFAVQEMLSGTPHCRRILGASYTATERDGCGTKKLR